ncbi:MAG: hypothetical protein H7A00_01045 [Hahellaceae bacterium]|nr:hypothetical protein [Hahellaceae bacterium]
MSNPDPLDSPDYQQLPEASLYGTATYGDLSGQHFLGSSDADYVDAGAGDDVLFGNKGDDYLLGGRGNDQYHFAWGDGRDTINDLSNANGETDKLVFESGITKDDLWFTRQGDNLVIDLVGSTDRVTLSQWYRDQMQQIEQVIAGGEVLANTDVELLISAMAAFGNPAAGDLVLAQSVKDDVAPALAAAWHTMT